MTVGPSEPILQGFRLAQGSARTPPVEEGAHYEDCSHLHPMLAIPTHQDHSTGERFVLWKEVEVLFENATCVIDPSNGALITFMKDDSFKE